ncbi:MAG: glycosyltransferase family 2 protein [Leptolyngbyaceae cyanobacterium SU_3_3]|nr:glycosyltransferase family 2 protein [Leptolyngbyaceae cyanobacterium SU_3_3]
MPNRIKVIDIELDRPLETVTNLGGYQALQGLVKLHGSPIGYVQLPVQKGQCTASAIYQAIFPHYADAIIRQLVSDRIANPTLQSWQISDLLNFVPVRNFACLRVTVAFCPHRSTGSSLTKSLTALDQLDYSNLEVLVIENAPQNDSLQQLLQTHYPNFHYLYTDEPGRNRARNLAIAKSAGRTNCLHRRTGHR